MAHTLKPDSEGTIITPQQALKEVARYKPKKPSAAEPAPSAPASSEIVTESQPRFVELENICYMEGKVKRQYFKVEVMCSPFMENGAPKLLTQEQAIELARKHDLDIPSYALLCNLLAELYSRKNEGGEIEKLLRRLTTDPSTKFHLNTRVDFDDAQITHFRNNAEKERIEEGFNPAVLEDGHLEIALKSKQVRQYVQKLTGLENPEILSKIARHYGKIPFFNGTPKVGICTSYWHPSHMWAVAGVSFTINNLLGKGVLANAIGVRLYTRHRPRFFIN